MATDTYIEVGQLAPILQDALKRVGYGRKDIRVIPVTETEPGHHAYGDGFRAFVVAIDLDGQQVTGGYGSWGGANPYTTTLVDDAQDRLAMVPHVALIKGQSGSKVFAGLYVHPDQLRDMLPVVDETSDKDQQVLYCYKCIKGGQYRRDEMRRRGVTDEDVADMVARGYLSANKAGAVQITLKGKNAFDRTRAGY